MHCAEKSLPPGQRISSKITTSSFYGAIAFVCECHESHPHTVYFSFQTAQKDEIVKIPIPEDLVTQNFLFTGCHPAANHMLLFHFTNTKNHTFLSGGDNMYAASEATRKYHFTPHCTPLYALYPQSC